MSQKTVVKPCLREVCGKVHNKHLLRKLFLFSNVDCDDDDNYDDINMRRIWFACGDIRAPIDLPPLQNNSHDRFFKSVIFKNVSRLYF